MPVCFQLLNKATGVVDSFNDVDRKLCTHLGVEIDPDYYYHHWYPNMGIRMAQGRTDYRDIHGNDYNDVADFIEANYEIIHWRE